MAHVPLAPPHVVARDLLCQLEAHLVLDFAEVGLVGELAEGGKGNRRTSIPIMRLNILAAHGIFIKLVLVGALLLLAHHRCGNAVNFERGDEWGRAARIGGFFGVGGGFARCRRSQLIDHP